MFCYKCGCKIGEADMICPECGTARSEMEYNGGFWNLVGENRILEEGQSVQESDSTTRSTDKTLKNDKQDMTQTEWNLRPLRIVSILFIAVLILCIFQTFRASRSARKYNRMKDKYDILSASYEELERDYECIYHMYDDPASENAANRVYPNDEEETEAVRENQVEESSLDEPDDQESQDSISENDSEALQGA